MSRNKLLTILVICLIFFLLLQMYPVKQADAATLEKSSQSFDTFKDLEGHWAEEEILRLVKLGVVAGYQDKTFRPKQNISREEFVKLLIISLKLVPVNKNDLPFTDLPISRWSTPYIQTAFNSGILIPNEFGSSFSPTKPITRAEMAFMVARAAHLEPDESAASFSDTKILTSNKGLIGAAVKAGILNGFPDGSFKPNDPSTRAEAVIMIIHNLDYQPTTENNITLQPNVLEIKSTNYTIQDELIQLPSSSALETLKQGDIFTLPPSEDFPFGVARKVVSVLQEENITKIQTIKPDITEVVDNAEVNSVVSLDSDDFKLNPALASGVTVASLENKTPLPLSIPNATNALNRGTNVYPTLIGSSTDNRLNPVFTKKEGEFTSAGRMSSLTPTRQSPSLTSLGATVYVDDDRSVGIKINEIPIQMGSQVATLTGDINLSKLAVDFKSKIKHGKLKYARAELSSDATISVNLDLPDVQVQYSNHKAEDFTINLGEFTTRIYGPLGASFELYLVLNADYNSEAKIILVNKNHIDLGFEYVNKNVQGINDSEVSAEIEVKGDVEANFASGLKLAVMLDIFDYKPAGIETKLGFSAHLEGHATSSLDSKLISDASFCYKYNVNAFFAGDAVLRIPHFFEDTTVYSFILFDLEKVLKEKDTCKPKPTLSLEQAKEIYHEGREKFYSYSVDQKDKSLVFKDSLTTLTNYFTLQLLNDVYEYFGKEWDIDIFPGAIKVSSSLLKVDDTHYQLSTIELPDEIDKFYGSLTIIYELQGENWVVSDMVSKKGDLNLTQEEAKKILELGGGKAIEYLGSGTISHKNDLYNGPYYEFKATFNGITTKHRINKRTGWEYSPDYLPK